MKQNTVESENFQNEMLIASSESEIDFNKAGNAIQPEEDQ